MFVGAVIMDHLLRLRLISVVLENLALIVLGSAVLREIGLGLVWIILVIILVRLCLAERQKQQLLQQLVFAGVATEDRSLRLRQVIFARLVRLLTLPELVLGRGAVGRLVELRAARLISQRLWKIVFVEVPIGSHYPLHQRVIFAKLAQLLTLPELVLGLGVAGKFATLLIARLVRVVLLAVILAPQELVSWVRLA